MRGLSIDIGLHNTSVYCEEFFKIYLPKLAKTKRHQRSGLPTQNYQDILDSIYSRGKTIYFVNNDFARDINVKKLKVNDFISILSVVNNYFDSIVTLISKCDFVIIERQLKTNPYAQRLEQHIVSWFTIKVPSLKVIIYPASHKTSILGAPKKIKGKGRKPLRKKWCVEECKKILEKRKDEKTLTALSRTKKKDDLSDTVCQLASFKVCLMLDGKLM